MTLITGTLFALVIGLQQPGVTLAVDDLTRVRELYALASYEEALARIEAAGSRIVPERAAEYRALCLLGLNRAADAARTIEELVAGRPAYEMVEADVPPRLYAIFRDARERALPARARAHYTAAKAAFDARGFDEAVREFRAALALLTNDALVTEIDGLRDLRTLSAGFLNLAEVEIERLARAAAEPPPAFVPPSPVATTASLAPAAGGTRVAAVEPAPPAPAAAMPASPAPAADAAASGHPASAPAAAPASAPAPASVPESMAAPAVSVPAPAPAAAIYGDGDTDVRPPVEVSRRLPGWNPPPALARIEFRGLLEVVIDETGAVAVTSLVRSVHPGYDDALVAAAARWRFQPATRDGVPVQYRKTFEIVLNRR